MFTVPFPDAAGFAPLWKLRGTVPDRCADAADPEIPTAPVTQVTLRLLAPRCYLLRTRTGRLDALCPIGLVAVSRHLALLPSQILQDYPEI